MLLPKKKTSFAISKIKDNMIEGKLLILNYPDTDYVYFIWYLLFINKTN